jgi:hypothetical protein
MTKKILFLGCSNLAEDKQEISKEQIWKDVVFGDDVDITNLSYHGVGNQFIFGNCVDYISDHEVDYVYCQFTGLARHDICIDEEARVPGYDYAIKTYKRRYLCSGGKVGSWTGNNRTTEIFMPVYFREGKYDHVARESVQAVAGTIWFLQQHKIPFNWTFFYDICDPAHPDEENYDGRVNEFPTILDKTHWIDSDPHTYCYHNNGLQEDNCHFKNPVYKQWLQSVREQLDYHQ